MSRPIQSPQAGYLGMLGLKNMGKLPDVAEDNVQPVVDIQPFYTAGNRRYSFGSTNALAAGAAGFENLVATTGTFTVPANKVWILDGGDAYVEVAAASVFSVGAIVVAVNFGNAAATQDISESFGIGNQLTAAAAPPQTARAAAPLQRGVVLLAGTVVGVNVLWRHGAGGAACVVRITYSEYDA